MVVMEAATMSGIRKIQGNSREKAENFEK